MTAPELKPCPFCGGKNIGWAWRQAYSCDSSYAFFGCLDCQIGSDMADEDNTMHPDDVAEWNRRADLPPTLEHAKALPEIKALVEALNACMASLERADTEEGVCCCGDDMATHGGPINCGHIPVDMGDYYAGKALDAARAALRAIGEGGE